MDPVNEQLLEPTEYPAADDSYNHPMWWKGTEMEERKTANPDYLTLAIQIVRQLERLAEIAPKGHDIEGLARMDASDLMYFVQEEQKRVGPKAHPQSKFRGLASVITSDEVKIMLSRLRNIDNEVNLHPEIAEQLDCDWNVIGDAIEFVERRAPTQITNDDRDWLKGMNISASKREASIDLHTAPPIGSPRYDQREHLDADVKEEIEADVKEAPAPEVKVRPRLLRSR